MSTSESNEPVKLLGYRMLNEDKYHQDTSDSSNTTSTCQSNEPVKLLGFRILDEEKYHQDTYSDSSNITENKSTDSNGNISPLSKLDPRRFFKKEYSLGSTPPDKYYCTEAEPTTKGRVIKSVIGCHVTKKEIAEAVECEPPIDLVGEKEMK